MGFPLLPQKSVTSGWNGRRGGWGKEQKNQAPASPGVWKVWKENRPGHPCRDRVFSSCAPPPVPRTWCRRAALGARLGVPGTDTRTRVGWVGLGLAGSGDGTLGRRPHCACPRAQRRQGHERGGVGASGLGRAQRTESSGRVSAVPLHPTVSPQPLPLGARVSAGGGAGARRAVSGLVSAAASDLRVAAHGLSRPEWCSRGHGGALVLVLFARVPSRDAANAPAPQPCSSSPVPPRPRAEPPPAPPRAPPGPRQPAPPSARPRGRRRLPSRRRCRCASPAVTQAAVPGNFLLCRDHPAPGEGGRAGLRCCWLPSTVFRTGKAILSTAG